MNMGPKVTVVLPAYNVARFLRESVESILEQTFSDFIFLIMEGGSTDGTREIIESYRDQRIVIRELPAAEFPSVAHWCVRARNVGIASAKSPFIACMDADDISFSRRFECQLEILEENPDIVALGTGYDFITESGTLGMRPHDGRLYRSAKKGLDLHVPGLAHGSVMLRREASGKAGGYREEFLVAQDLDFWLRLAEQGDVAMIDIPQFIYRINLMSLTNHPMARTDIYSRLARKYSRERLQFGQDSLQKGDPMPAIPWGGTRYAKWMRCQKKSLTAAIEGRRSEAVRFALRALSLRPHRPGGWRLLLEALHIMSSAKGLN